MMSLITHFTFKVQRNLLFFKKFAKLWLVIGDFLKVLLMTLFNNSLRRYNMSRGKYNGNVSIIKNTKNAIAVKADAEGKYNQENVGELYAAMQKHNKAIEGSTLNAFTPEPKGTNLQPVLLSGLGNQPYLALLPEDSKRAGLSRIVVLD